MQKLSSLIKEAQQLAHAPCDRGDHLWSSIGGRGCAHPEDIGGGECSQAVYVCDACGATDYGERGGPGHADCMDCKLKHLATDYSFWYTKRTVTTLF